MQDFRIDNVPARVRRARRSLEAAAGPARPVRAGAAAVTPAPRVPLPPDGSRERPDDAAHRRRAGSTSPSGTASAAWPSGTDDAVGCNRKAGKPLGPLLPRGGRVAAGAREPEQFVLDGEIVIPVDGRLSFDDLLMRIHPAASRVRTLVEEHPARLVVFDLLVDDRGKSLVDLPLARAAGAAGGVRRSDTSRATGRSSCRRPPAGGHGDARGSPAVVTAISTASSPSGSTCPTARARATGWRR